GRVRVLEWGWRERVGGGGEGYGRRFDTACGPVDITRDVVEQPPEVEAVADQRPSLQVLPECCDRRNAALQQCLRDDRAIAQEYRACGQNDRLPAGIVHSSKCPSLV